MGSRKSASQAWLCQWNGRGRGPGRGCGTVTFRIAVRGGWASASLAGLSSCGACSVPRSYRLRSRSPEAAEGHRSVWRWQGVRHQQIHIAACDVACATRQEPNIAGCARRNAHYRRARCWRMADQRVLHESMRLDAQSGLATRLTAPPARIEHPGIRPPPHQGLICS